jgi:hypothetical protein
MLPMLNIPNDLSDLLQAMVTDFPVILQAKYATEVHNSDIVA